MDAIGPDHVSAYYDPHNIVSRVKDLKDIYAEPKMLGQAHPPGSHEERDMLLSIPGGRVDRARMARELDDIGYGGWYVLDTASPTKDTSPIPKPTSST